jgi:hypothetical protein
MRISLQRQESRHLSPFVFIEINFQIEKAVKAATIN